MRRLAFILCLFFSACATERLLEAKRLLDEGRRDEALAVWTRRLTGTPDDAEAQHGRTQVLSAMAEERCGLAAEGDLAALVDTQRLVNQGAAPPKGLPRARARVAEIARVKVQAPLGLGQPLAALRVLAPLPLDAAGLEKERVEFMQEILRVGARRCVVLAGLAHTPHLASAVAAYCRTFNTAGPRVIPLPERRSALTVDAKSLVGLDAREVTTAAQQAFEASIWFEAGAPGAIDARVQGKLEITLEETPMTVTASWTETESYTVSESQTESYQESYMDQESTSETHQEPYTTTQQRPVTVSYTESESYTYSCGTYPTSRTCYGSRPVTRYRTEYRSETVTAYRSVTRQGMRTVTKYRPATRQVTRMVTKYRPVSRSFEYPAVQKHVTHRAKVMFVVALPGTQRALEVPYAKVVDETDAEHQATHPAAKLVPHRAAVTTAAEFEQLVARAVGTLAQAQLDEAWRASFCASFETPEEAARCVRVNGAPAQAWTVVARFFGEGEEEIRLLLR